MNRRNWLFFLISILRNSFLGPHTALHQHNSLSFMRVLRKPELFLPVLLTLTVNQIHPELIRQQP